MRLLKLMAVLGLDGRGFKAGLKEAESGVTKFARGLKGQIAGAFSSAALAAYVKNVTETVTRIKDLSEQYRITSTEVQQADQAMKRQGLTFENLASSLSRLAAARREAVEKPGEMREAFKALKVDITDLNNPMLRHFDILLKIANSTDAANMTIREESDLLEILGVRSLKVLSSLREIGDMKGVNIIEEDAIDRIDRADKALTRFKDNAKSWAADKMNTALLFWREGVGLTTDNAWERLAKENAKPLTKEQKAAALERLRNERQANQRSAEQGLFTVDKDVKETPVKDEGRSLGKAFDIRAPSLPGLAASGGFSGGIASLDPSLFIQRNQLTELKSINVQLKQIQTIIGSKLGSGAGLLGVFSR